MLRDLTAEVITEAEAAEDKESAELGAIEKSRVDIWDYFDTYVYDQWTILNRNIIEEFELLF